MKIVFMEFMAHIAVKIPDLSFPGNVCRGTVKNVENNLYV